jgi:outer membrane protein OmpA-like peptidoglycan-associated protein
MDFINTSMIVKNRNMFLMIAALIVACKSSSPTMSPSATIIPTVGSGHVSEPTRSITVGDPQNNSAVALIIASDVGGSEGIYISKQMDLQATDMGATQLKGVKILRVGEGIKVTFDGDLMFRKNSSRLSEQSKRNLDRLAETLVKYDKTKLIIEGHTDGTGSATHNQTLSEQRAQAVALYLSMRKIQPDRIKVSGYGETQPLFANTTEAGRTQNRRVELVIIADDKLRKEAGSSGTNQ